MKESLDLTKQKKSRGSWKTKQKFEEELERSRRLENLKQETDKKLAGVRRKAALTTLEAQLEEKLNDNEIIDTDLVSNDEEPQTEDILSIPPPYAED